MSLAGARTLCYPIVLLFSFILQEPCFFFFLLFFIFIKSCWSAIISPPQIKAHQTLLSILHTHKHTHTYTYIHTSDTHPGSSTGKHLTTLTTGTSPAFIHENGLQ